MERVEIPRDILAYTVGYTLNSVGRTDAAFVAHYLLIG